MVAIETNQKGTEGVKWLYSSKGRTRDQLSEFKANALFIAVLYLFLSLFHSRKKHKRTVFFLPHTHTNAAETKTKTETT